MTDPVPVESIELVFYRDFGDLLQHAGGENVTGKAAVDLFFEYGRSLLLAPAGAGKSTLLKRLEHQNSGINVVVRSISSLSVKLSPLTEDRFRRWLLRKSRRPLGARLLVGLDGLDEVSPTDAQAILDAVEAVTKKDPQLAVIITDRVTRRATTPGRWAFFEPPLIIASAESDWRSLPFFQGDPEQPNDRTGFIREKLDELANIHSSSTDALAGAAFTWLREMDSTAAPSEQLARIVGEDSLATLVASGVIEETDGVGRFAHPLYHAYFAAEYLRDRPERWEGSAWEVVTVNGGSFSALGLLLESAEPGNVDALVRSVDRWNYVASASLLAEDRAPDQRIPDDIRSALLLLLGFRRLSPVLNTAVIADDALKLQQGSELVRSISSSSSWSELAAIAASLPISTDWWVKWIGIFTEREPAALVGALADDDYLIAWTAANALSSREVGEPVERELLELALVSESRDERWRAVHSLGSSRNPEVAITCLRAFLSDEEEWVRYGALRVCLQVVSRIPEGDVRAQICRTLADSADRIRGNSRWEREIERAADLRDAPPDWPETFGLIVSALLDGSRSLAEEDRWRAATAMLTIKPSDPFGVALRPVMGGASE